jgi:hypothetical protein
MGFGTRKIDSHLFDSGASSDIYEVFDGDRVIGTRTVHSPATGPLIEITYRLGQGDQAFSNVDAFISAYLMGHGDLTFANVDAFMLVYLN